MLEDEIATEIIFQYAPIVSAEQENFGAWLSVGSGATLALLIGNVENVIGSMATWTFVACCILLLLSLLVFAVQRWLAMRVRSIVAIRAIVAGTAPANRHAVDVEKLVAALIHRSIQPFRWFMRRAADKPSDTARDIAHLAQKQTIAIFLQGSLVFSAACVAVVGIVIVWT